MFPWSFCRHAARQPELNLVWIGWGHCCCCQQVLKTAILNVSVPAERLCAMSVDDSCGTGMWPWSSTALRLLQHNRGVTTCSQFLHKLSGQEREAYWWCGILIQRIWNQLYSMRRAASCCSTVQPMYCTLSQLTHSVWPMGDKR